MLRPGAVFITDSRDEFTLDLDRPWHDLLITVPTEWLDERLTHPELVSGAVLTDHPLVHLCASHLASGFRLAGEFSQAGAALFARHSLELLAQVLEESQCVHPTESDAWRAATYLTACQIIALKYRDPNLTPDQIAMDVGVSTRTLERLFAAHEETIMRRVYDARICEAAKMLGGGMPRRSVTEIAFATGFNDVSHFGRTFAAKLGMTPTEWRRRGKSQEESARITRRYGVPWARAARSLAPFQFGKAANGSSTRPA